jgi:hypothetical protein
MTASNDFPLLNPAQPGQHVEPNGQVDDVFVAKLDPTCSRLLFATYLGGSDFDWPGGIAVDALGNT